MVCESRLRFKWNDGAVNAHTHLLFVQRVSRYGYAMLGFLSFFYIIFIFLYLYIYIYKTRVKYTLANLCATFLRAH